MRRVTEEEVKEAAQQRTDKQWFVRHCSICGSPLHYYFFDDHATFDPSCDCVTTKGLFERRTYQEIANFLNMQTPEVRSSLWKGLTGKADIK